MNWQSVATKTVEVTRMEMTASDFVSLTSLSFATCVMPLAKNNNNNDRLTAFDPGQPG